MNRPHRWIRRLFAGVLGIGLAAPASAQPQLEGVLAEQKVSSTAGGFSGPLATSDAFGVAMASLGDLDGDGIGDLAVGALGDNDGGGNTRGAVWILFLDADGTVKSHQKISATSGGFGGVLEPDAAFGAAVACLGDLDGDGVVDLAVGSPGDDDGSPSPPTITDLGAVWILFLDTDGTVKSHQKISATQGDFTGFLRWDDQFGRGLANLGDIDGDGVVDLAVGAIGDDGADNLTPGTGRGAVWVLFLDADGTVKAHTHLSNANGTLAGQLVVNANFGMGIAPLGDLDGNGTPDMAVGAPRDYEGVPLVRYGAVFILFMQPDGTVGSYQRIGHSDGGLVGPLDDDDDFGMGLAALGDIGGDGLVDLAIGAIGDDDAGFDHGATYIVELAQDGTVLAEHKIGDPTEPFLIGPLDAFDGFGMGMAGLGDHDGDGRRDLAIGASSDDDGGRDRGAVWISFLDGAATGPWTDLGHALAGTHGPPRLVGVGTLVGGEPFALTLSDALPGATSWMVLGVFELAAAFRGGVLVPDPTPPALVLPLPVAPDGTLVLATTWPPGVPSGAQILVQHAIQDAGGPLGFALSNAVRGVTP